MSTASDVSWDEARAQAAALGRRLPSETAALHDADRRITAAALMALIDLPSADTSAMDGWAVADDPPWTVIAAPRRGEQPAPILLAHQAIPIVTGAPIPAGTTAIVRTENGWHDDAGALLGEASADDIRRRAEECARGDELVAAGVELTPMLLGLLAAAGHDTVEVTRRPRVRLVLGGDELAVAGIPAGGHVRDALGPQLPAWLARAGADVTDVRRIGDSLSELVEGMTAPGVDLVITTGGTGAGPSDHVHAALADSGGELLVDGVAVRPGHPMVLATVGDRPVVALPGNPQAAVVGLLTLAMPLLATMLGRTVGADATVPVAESLTAPDARTRLVGGVITPAGFRRTSHSGPAMLRGLAASTGYAVVPPGGVAPGETVRWLPLA